MARQRFLGRAELHVVPLEARFGGVHLRVEKRDLALHRRNVAVGDRELFGDRADFSRRGIEFGTLGVQLGVNDVEFRLLGFDLRVERRVFLRGGEARCECEREQDEGEGEGGAAEPHRLRLSIATNEPACRLANDFNSAATSPML